MTATGRSVEWEPRGNRTGKTTNDSTAYFGGFWAAECPSDWEIGETRPSKDEWTRIVAYLARFVPDDAAARENETPEGG